MNKHGHSLIELTIVLTIFTFFATLSIGSLTYLDRINVRCTAEKMLADISHMQQQAMVIGKAQAIDLQSYRLPQTVQFSAITFHDAKISAAASGVLCAGSVYLTNDKNCSYAITIPVGGATPRVQQK